MIVVKKETLLFKNKDEDKKNGLKGIKCMWFTSDGAYQEHIFNTKDIQYPAFIYFCAISILSLIEGWLFLIDL